MQHVDSLSTSPVPRQAMSNVGDLCTLPELTDSSILSCLEQRYHDGIVYTSIGSVRLALDPCLSAASHQDRSRTHAYHRQLVNNIVKNVISTQEDNVVLLYGVSGAGKSFTSRLIMLELLNTLTVSKRLREKVHLAEKVFGLLTQRNNLTSACLSVRSVCVDPGLAQFSGLEYSLALLDVDSIAEFQVFSQLLPAKRGSQNGSISGYLSEMKEALHGLGLSQAQVGDFEASIFTIAALIAPDQSTVTAYEGLGVSMDTFSSLVSGAAASLRLARLLYVYLVRTVVCWLNSCLHEGPTDLTCSVIIVDPVGMRLSSAAPAKPQPDTATLAQLLHGYLGEVLHNIFCQRLFVWEQDQYLEEQLDWEVVDVECNYDLVHALQEPDGLLHCLGRESVSSVLDAISEYSTRAKDIWMTHEVANGFVLAFHTGEQAYSVSEEWLQSNTDMSPGDFVALLSSSTIPLLNNMAKVMLVSGPDMLLGQSPLPGLLSERAQQAASLLYDIITASTPHFLLCVKPSEREFHLDQDMVFNQLQPLRVLDTALIQGCGYPVHVSHAAFTERYAAAVLKINRAEPSSESCSRILTVAGLDDWQIGTTKVMLKPWHLDQLDDLVTLYHRSAVKLQHAFRRRQSHKGSHKIKDLQVLKEMLELPMDRVDEIQLSSTPTPPPRPLHTHMRRVSDQQQMNRPPSPPGPPPGMKQASLPEMSPGVHHPGVSHWPLSDSSPDDPYIIMESPGQAGVNHHPDTSHRLLSDSDMYVIMVGPDHADGNHQPDASYRPLSDSYSPDDPYIIMDKTGHAAHGAEPAKEQKQSLDHKQSHFYESQKAFSSKKRSWGKKMPSRESTEQQLPSVSLETLSWYHGKISRVMADKRLRIFPSDCFLIRESENRIGSFSLSLKFAGIIKHFRIDRQQTSGRYCLYGAQRSFTSLTTLVDHHTQYCVSSSGGELLRTPCPSEETGANVPPPLPPPRRLSTIRRPKKQPPASQETYSRRGTASKMPRQSSMGQMSGISDEAVSNLQKELEVEERIVEAARRMCELPSASKKEKQIRKKSLQESLARVLRLRQQYHTLQDKLRFLQISLQNGPNISEEDTNYSHGSAPDPLNSAPPVPPRH